MRVEQRIGRIDRYGQKSDKVLIFNFITPGTVEERIFFRCFDRLGLFRDAIGDTEEVLGNIIYELNQIALDTKLSAEQAEAKARQLAENKIRYIEEQRHLEAEHEGILGVEKSFSEDVETLIEEDDRDLYEIFKDKLNNLTSIGIRISKAVKRYQRQRI